MRPCFLWISGKFVENLYDLSCRCIVFTKFVCIFATLKHDNIMTRYTTSQVNFEWKIKVYGLFNGQKVNTLVGVAGYLRMVEDNALAERLLDRAFASQGDKCICKLRRGLKISFYRH